MDRLTMTSDKGGVALTFDLDITCKPSEIKKILHLAERLKAYEDTGLTPEEAAELSEARKDGWLVVLPCKVGDKVFEVHADRGIISTLIITTVCIEQKTILFCWDLVDGIYKRITGFYAHELGKTVFLTREAAEAALGGKADEV